MAAIQDEYKEKFEINKVKNSTLTPLTKRSRIQEVKRSFLTKKNSSIKTILTIANTMVGSAIVVFPLIFSTSGLMTSLIVLAFVGVVSCKTCSLEIIHFKMSELDFPDAINRILGRKWFIAYTLCSVLLLFLCGVIYFILICNMLYPFMKYVLESNGVEVAPIDTISFSQFSFQYTGIIMITVCFILFCLKDLKIILKMGQYGIFSILIFFVYILIRGFMNLSEVSLDNVTIFTADVANLCGVFALSFFIHNIIIPIMKNNRNEKNNQRDVILGYGLTGLLYAIIGIFGALSIAGIDLGGRKANTVLDYYTPNIGTAIIEILLFLQLLSVEPILWYVARSQFFNLIYKNDSVPNTYFILSNVVFAGVCLIIQIMNVDPTLIISLNGAVCGFLLVYIIPIKMHMTCLYSHPDVIKKSLLSDTPELYDNVNRPSIITTTEDGAMISDLRVDKLEEEAGTGNINCGMPICNSMHNDRRGKMPKNVRYFLYFLLILVGLAFAVIKIVNLAVGK